MVAALLVLVIASLGLALGVDPAAPSSCLNVSEELKLLDLAPPLYYTIDTVSNDKDSTTTVVEGDKRLITSWPSTGAAKLNATATTPNAPFYRAGPGIAAIFDRHRWLSVGTDGTLANVSTAGITILARLQMSTSDAGGNSVLFSVGTTGRTLESLGGVVLGVDANDHAVGIYGSRVVKTLPPRNHDDDSTYRVPMNSQALRTLLFTASPSESRIYLDCILVASETAALGTLSTLDTAAIGAAKDGSAGVLGFSGALDSLIVVPRALTNDEALRALKFYKKSQQPLNHTAGKCPNECFHSEDTRTTHGDCVLVGTEYKCQCSGGYSGSDCAQRVVSPDGKKTSVWSVLGILVAVVIGLLCLERLYASCKRVYIRKTRGEGFSRLPVADTVDSDPDEQELDQLEREVNSELRSFDERGSAPRLAEAEATASASAAAEAPAAAAPSASRRSREPAVGEFVDI